MTETTWSCRDCLYHKPVNEYGGECRGNPPQLVVLNYPNDQVGMETHFPFTAMTGWCRLWAQKNRIVYPKLETST